MPKLSKEKEQAIRELLRFQGASDKMADTILQAAQAETEQEGASATKAMHQQLLEELREQKRKGIKFGRADILEFLGQDEDVLPPEFEQLVDEPRGKQKGSPGRPRFRAPLPPVIREIVIPEQTTVAELAALLEQTKFQILADLLMLNVDLDTNQTPDYKTIAKVARMHGYIAKRPA
jgi:hypothetical protein